MENSGRRKFIRALTAGLGLLPLLRVNEASAGSYNALIELPPLPFQESLIEGKLKGGRILIVGGIHGNEPGAYKAAEILRHVKLNRGELLIAPRTNFVSILTNKRGYNGDMNRKFAQISKEDRDYPQVKKLKELILSYKPDLLLTLHDGFGFHALNPSHWGQCIVIDEERYNGIELGRQARLVSKRVSALVKRESWRFPVFNTHTFSPRTKHPEQRKSLTYFCLKNSIPAICLEVSKQLPSLSHKVAYHLLMINEFFKIHKIETEPPIEEIVKNLKEFLEPRVSYCAELQINGRRLTVSSSKSFKIPKGSTVKFLSFSGTEGTNVITQDVNANLRRVGIKRRIAFRVKDDFKEVFKVRFIVV